MEINSNLKEDAGHVEIAPDGVMEASPAAAGSALDQAAQRGVRQSVNEKESLTQSYDYMEEMLQQQDDGANLDMASREPNDITGNQYYGMGQQPMNTKRYWNAEEDLNLTKLVRQFGAKNWKKIASYLD